MMSNHIFISRALSKDSIFFRLEDRGYVVDGQSLLRIQFLDIKLPQKFDAVFFYSGIAINHFFSSQAYNSDLSYGVMGQASAHKFKTQTGHKADIIGEGDMQRLYSMISEKWSGYAVLVPQATHSIQRLERLKTINCFSLPIYKNTINREIEIPETDIVLLTSPLNVEAYLAQYTHHGKALYAIGETTAKRIEELTDRLVPYCDIPSEEALYNLLLDNLT